MHLHLPAVGIHQRQSHCVRGGDRASGNDAGFDAGPNWQLIWSDEFDGTALDMTKWNTGYRFVDVIDNFRPRLYFGIDLYAQLHAEPGPELVELPGVQNESEIEKIIRDYLVKHPDVLQDALASIGLVEKREDRFTNVPVAAAALAAASAYFAEAVAKVQSK